MKKILTYFSVLLFLVLLLPRPIEGAEDWASTINGLTEAARQRTTKDCPTPYLTISEIEGQLLSLKGDPSLMTIGNAYRQAALIAENDETRYHLMKQFALELDFLNDKSKDPYDRGCQPLTKAEVRTTLEELLWRLWPKTKNEKPVRAGKKIPVVLLRGSG